MDPEEVTQGPIPLSRPWYGEEETRAVTAALAGRLSGDGPACRAAEARLKELLGAGNVLLATSCTHALELALLALGVGPGDEVIVPSFTFASCANAVLRVGAKPVFADIEPATLGLDPDDVGPRITPKTKALMPVHYAGVAAPMEGLLATARERKLLVVEDAAHALGGSFRGRALGTLGDAGCFSFHETKNVTCGEGGAVTFRDERAARRAEIIREKGTNRSAFLRGEVDRYSWVSEGSSYVLAEPLAALLNAQLDRFDEIQKRRAAICARYFAALEPWARSEGAVLPVEPEGCVSARHVFFVLYPDVTARDAALSRLRADGIQASFHYVPLHAAPHARAAGLYPGALPVTESIASRLVRLPLFPTLTDDEVSRVIDGVTRGASRA